jgi:hypothetical protein
MGGLGKRKDKGLYSYSDMSGGEALPTLQYDSSLHPEPEVSVTNGSGGILLIVCNTF